MKLTAPVHLTLKESGLDRIGGAIAKIKLLFTSDNESSFRDIK
ncbi:hypothetical protein [Leptolyngbya sp. FACHB-321]|nr:hypothetical protein [Leptolyngbya sp. FACHB-321]